MNVEIGAEAALFPEKEYINGIFVAVWYSKKPAEAFLGISTANEGPARIQNKCLVSIYVLPEMKLLFLKQNYNVLSPSSYTHIVYL
jgi:hypothetical protein